MEKITRKMSKGNLTGIGVGLASLILSGCLIASYEKKMDDLTDNLDRVEEKAKKVIIIAEGYKQENSMYKLKISELTNSVQVLENEKLKLKNNLDEVKKANTALKSELDKSRIEKIKVQKKAEEVKKNIYSVDGSWMTFTQTHYTSFCNTGCIGKTATGMDVKNTIKYEGMNIIAVDPTKIPLGSIVEIDDGENIVRAIAGDTGGAIKGNKIDFLVSTNDRNYAYSLGVKEVKLKIIRRGWAKA